MIAVSARISKALKESSNTEEEEEEEGTKDASLLDEFVAKKPDGGVLRIQDRLSSVNDGCSGMNKGKGVFVIGGCCRSYSW